MRSISLSSYGFRELINQAIASGEVSPLEAKCMEEGALMLIRREGEEGAEEMKLRPFELLVSESISMAEFLEVFIFLSLSPPLFYFSGSALIPS